jgi:hypothetical protein
VRPVWAQVRRRCRHPPSVTPGRPPPPDHPLGILRRLRELVSKRSHNRLRHLRLALPREPRGKRVDQDHPGDARWPTHERLRRRLLAGRQEGTVPTSAEPPKNRFTPTPGVGLSDVERRPSETSLPRSWSSAVPRRLQHRSRLPATQPQLWLPTSPGLESSGRPPDRVAARGVRQQAPQARAVAI